MSIIIGEGSGNAISVNSTVGTAGSVITSDGTNSYWGDGFILGVTQTTYTAPGTWTKPSTATTIKVTVVGAGGSGGLFAGGGGGGGGTAIIYLQAPAIPGPVAVTAGQGTNSFGAFASATSGSTGPAGPNGVPGAAGGVGSSGDINIGGGAGNYGEGVSPVFGALSGGNGGSSTMGGGGKGSAPAALFAVTPGNPGKNYGGGAGGGGNSTAGTGAPGIVIVEEYS